MKSSQKYYSEAPLKKSKKENAPDTISKSKFNLKSSKMSTLRNNVQLIGHVGQEPTITQLESGKKVARISLATNENFKNANGEKRFVTEVIVNEILLLGK